MNTQLALAYLDPWNLSSKVAILSIALTVGAQSAPITTLFNTGVDLSGNVLPDSTIGDPHYRLISVPGGTTNIRIRTAAGGYPIPPYIGDNTTSRWIGPNNNEYVYGPRGLYTYRTTFDLTGFNYSTASIDGGWSSDNQGVSIFLNGIDTLNPGTPANQFSRGFKPFFIDEGFLPGINTLDFQVFQDGGTPTALRVEMKGDATPAESVPETGNTAVLVGVMFVALGCSKKRFESISWRS